MKARIYSVQAHDLDCMTVRECCTYGRPAARKVFDEWRKLDGVAHVSTWIKAIR